MAGNRRSPCRRRGVQARTLSQPATPPELHARSTRPLSDSTPCALYQLRPVATACPQRQDRLQRCLACALSINHTRCFSTPLSPRRFVWSITLPRKRRWRARCWMGAELTRPRYPMTPPGPRYPTTTTTLLHDPSPRRRSSQDPKIEERSKIEERVENNKRKGEQQPEHLRTELCPQQVTRPQVAQRRSVWAGGRLAGRGPWHTPPPAGFGRPRLVFQQPSPRRSSVVPHTMPPSHARARAASS